MNEFHMPVQLDIDASDSEDEMIAIGAGQYRRKNEGADADDMEPDDDTMDDNGVNGTEEVANGSSKRRRGD